MVEENSFFAKIIFSCHCPKNNDFSQILKTWSPGSGKIEFVASCSRPPMNLSRPQFKNLDCKHDSSIF